jgi:DNA polymerase (family 10)
LKNALVAKILFEIADMLDMQDVQFKPAAYRRAARTVENLSMPIEDVYAKGGLDDLPGVGVAIAKKISEIVETWSLKYYEELKKSTPVDLESLTSIEGIGPKTVKLLYRRLGIKSIDELESAAKQHKIRTIKGLGPKVEQNILENVALARDKKKRVLLAVALPIAEAIAQELRNALAAKKISGKIEVAGSLRRMLESIGDIDILATCNQSEYLADQFTGMSDVRRVLEKGETKCSVVMKSNIQVDLRLVAEKSFGSALMYFTGSKDHNVALRRLAIEKKWKLNEYGLFSGETQLAGETEEEVYGKLGLSYLPPELREDHGEIAAAAAHKLPSLIPYDAIRGDLHAHTKWSDGTRTIEEMVHAAQAMGYEYVAITDHYSTLKVANGLSGSQIREQGKRIDELNKKLTDITVLKGCEVDIAPDGTLRVQKEVLRELDVVVASVHGSYKQTKKEMTDRLVAVMESGYINIIGHPTNRKITVKNSADIDMEKIFDVSKRTRTYLEINSTPQRLDINDANARAAIQAGCKLAIDTDAHHTEDFMNIRLGLGVARRVWAEAKDIINTQSLDDLKQTLRK